MVIIDKEYIAKMFKQALSEQGFSNPLITITETLPNMRLIKFDGMDVFSLVMSVSQVMEIPPIISVISYSYTVDMIQICQRADELLQKKAKIFLN